MRIKSRFGKYGEIKRVKRLRRFETVIGAKEKSRMSLSPILLLQKRKRSFLKNKVVVNSGGIISAPNSLSLIKNKMEKKRLKTERLAVVGQSVSNVAHEIRKSLMIIGGFSRQLRNNLTHEKDIKKLAMVIDEVCRLENLVDNLSDITKEYKLDRRPADINLVIHEVLKIMKDIYPSDKYTFDTDMDKTLDKVICDTDKLKQVLMNVIVNGIEAMAAGGGKIIISTTKWLNDFEIRIQDDGTGIDEKHLLRIFKPFYTTKQKGSGLGLSISHRIVQAHGGGMRAVSVPGEGAAFIIKLPLK
jgi:signal transduction histidine kinase